MRYRTKCLLSLLLILSMVLSVDVFSFGEEVRGKSSKEYEESVSLTSNGNSDGHYDYSVSASVPADLIAEISANFPSMSENLAVKDCLRLDTEGVTYLVMYDRATGYGGAPIRWSGFGTGVAVGRATGVDVDVYYKLRRRGTVSEGDVKFLIDYCDERYGYLHEKSMAELDEHGLSPAEIKMVKIKDPRGATVRLNGEPVVPLKKGCYVTSIKLKDKDLNRDFNKALKDHLKALKTADKSVRVSANGIREGGSPENEGDRCYLYTAVYPAYLYSNFLNEWFDVIETITGESTGSPHYHGCGKIRYAYVGSKNYDCMCTQNVKLNGNKVKSVKVCFAIDVHKRLYRWYYTLKPGKGLMNEGEPYHYNGENYENCQYIINGEPKDLYKVEASGNYFGPVVYDPEMIKPKEKDTGD